MFVKAALAGIICNLAICSLGFAVLVRPVPAPNQTIAILETMLAATEKPIPLNYSRMGIGGVRLGMSVAEAKRKLGKPQREETKSARPGIGGKFRTLTYKNLTVSAWNEKVYAISTTKPEFTTIDKIKVGDSKEKVVKTYGFGSQSVDGNAIRLTYSNDEKASNLIFELRDSRVQKIICSTQLN